MLKHFIVSGRFLIPGTRKVATLAPVRVVARDRSHATVQLAPVLSDQYAKALPRDVRIAPDFILLNCRIVEAPSQVEYRDLSAAAE